MHSRDSRSPPFQQPEQWPPQRPSSPSHAYQGVSNEPVYGPEMYSRDVASDKQNLSGLFRVQAGQSVDQGFGGSLIPPH